MRTIPSQRGLIASIALCSLLLGCQSMPPPPAGQPPFGSVAQITAISPDATRELRAGEQVQLKVEVQYVLTADSGTIELIVLAADNSVIAKQVAAIARGRGTATLQAAFTVPRTPQIRVYAPIVYQGQDSSSNTDGRSFAVVPR